MIRFQNFVQYDSKTRRAIFLLAVFFVIFLLVFFSNYARPRLLKVSFYDIGQGDGIFIETPARYQILVDAGPGPKILEELARDMPFYDRTIDVIIPTHPDSDHVAGLIDVLSRYQVNGALLSSVRGNTIVYSRLLHDIRQEGSLVSTGARQREPINLPGNVSLQVLNPDPGEPQKTTNDASIVTLLRYGKITFLLLADVTTKREQEILPLLPRHVDVIKIAHHGSKFSSGKEFLRSLSPALCVIQVGENHYGHPSPQALKAIDDGGCRPWRTDKQGTLTLYSDGNTYWKK